MHLLLPPHQYVLDQDVEHARQERLGEYVSPVEVTPNEPEANDP